MFWYNTLQLVIFLSKTWLQEICYIIYKRKKYVCLYIFSFRNLYVQNIFLMSVVNIFVWFPVSITTYMYLGRCRFGFIFITRMVQWQSPRCILTRLIFVWSSNHCVRCCIFEKLKYNHMSSHATTLSYLWSKNQYISDCVFYYQKTAN